MKSWIKAARLPSQSYIALPLILGQVHAWAATGSWSWKVFVLVQLYGVFDQFYIVFANDYADYETDLDNDTATIFSGGSRVLVDGDLKPRQLRGAALFCAGMCIALSGILAVSSPLIPPLVWLGLGLLWAYSYAPIRLSYRGGGELLQMVGVGAVLPLIGFAAQSGGVSQFPWELLALVIPLQYACAVTTALPDEPSDRRSHKRTLPVVAGSRIARAVVCLVNAGVFAVYVTSYPITPWIAIAAVGLVLTFASVYFARPGSKAINVFAFSSILTNLGIIGAEILRVIQ